MTVEPWPYKLFPGITPERTEQMWPRDQRFRPDKIKLARQARGLTIAEAAARTGISPKRWSRLERNLTTPTADNKLRICEGLGFPEGFFAQDDLVIDFRSRFRAHLN